VYPTTAIKRRKNMEKQERAIVIITILAVILLPLMVLAGDLEPSAAPGPTMKTLDQIPPTWSIKLSCSSTSDCPRFEGLSYFGEEVLDKETGLVWVAEPMNYGSRQNWFNAQVYCSAMAWGDRRGWRLPTVQELTSLVDLTPEFPDPSLPPGHPFAFLSSQLSFWSATTSASDANDAWVVSFIGGSEPLGTYAKDGLYYAWCVRGGRGVDPQ
jgi:hypothetical protein